MNTAETPNEDLRTQELSRSLAAVHERIDRALVAAGREDRPELIVVTKYFPAADVERLHSLGVRHVGENKDQEAAAKAAESGHLEGLNWHFIGQLQSNKAKSVARYAHAVHAADRVKIVRALANASAAAREAGQRTAALDCLIQVDLRSPVPNDGRGGAVPADVPALAEAVAESEHLRLTGLMAVAPLDEPAGPAFQRLAELSVQLRKDHPEAAAVSAGMSQDLEEAVAHGATHLRIGRDVLGERPDHR